MNITQAKIESDKITDSLDKSGYDLGGWRGEGKLPPEPLFSIGRQFELMRIILANKDK